MNNISMRKHENIIAVFKRFFGNEPVTKPELVRSTGITMSTVHNIVNMLENAGLVLPAGNEEPRGGRRAVLYRLNYKLCHIIGVYIGTDFIACGVYDLMINERCYRERRLELRRCTVIEAIDIVCEEVKALIEESGVNQRTLLGIGVSVAGIVNAGAGRVTAITKVNHWRDVQLREILEERLHMPVCIEKDTDGAALAVKRTVFFNSVSDMAYLSIENGVGLTILNNGRVHKFREGASCELGHVSVDINGPFCPCGGRGCLELYACGGVIRGRLKKYMQETPQSILADICKADGEELSIDDIIKADIMGDQNVHREFEQFKHYIMLCIDNVIKLYAPRLIVLNSDWIGRNQYQFANILSLLNTSSIFINRKEIDIQLNPLDHINVRGGVAALLERELDKKMNSFVFRYIKDDNQEEECEHEL